MEMNTFISKKRALFFVILMGFAILSLVVKYGGYMLRKEVEIKETKIIAERGSILDRHGKILAVETTLYNLTANKNLIKDPALYAEVLSPIINIPETTLFSKIETTQSNFLYLKKKISESEKDILAETIKTAKLRGLRIEPIVNRTYPENGLASTVIGFLGDDGKGLSGIEYSLQNLLSPPPETEGYTGKGYDVVLTIDSNIQYMMEKIATETMKKTQAEGIIFLATNAKTGEILAYVNEPSVDLSNFAKSTEQERFDRPAYFTYEPGSVFKIFSMAAFLELGATTDNGSYYCNGTFIIDPKARKQHLITCLRPHGWVAPRDILKYSCNVGTAEIVDKVNQAQFEKIFREFGFGKKTNIQLPGETRGLFAPSSQWSQRSKHTIAIGQEIGVSSLQIIKAATALTNEGYPLNLSLISEIYSPEGKSLYKHEKSSEERVISSKTAKQVLNYMQTTAETGTGWRASIGDVPIAVKTGTAQMANKNSTGYSKTDYLASCIGIFPVTDPEVILYMAVIRPKGDTYGSVIVAPSISKAANEIIDYRGMERAKAPMVSHTGIIKTHKISPIEIGATMPNLIGTPKRSLIDLLNRKDITVILKGEGYVYEQKPKKGSTIKEGSVIELNFQ